MKKILYILCVLLVIAGCGKSGEEKKTLTEQLYGEWHSTSLSVSGDVYINFTEAKTFELYQKIGEGAYRLYRGTWNVEEDLLTGKYNDGEDWASAYRIKIEDNKLTMTSMNDASEVTTYTAAMIPEDVMRGCEIVVKSAEAGF